MLSTALSNQFYAGSRQLLDGKNGSIWHKPTIGITHILLMEILSLYMMHVMHKTCMIHKSNKIWEATDKW